MHKKGKATAACPDPDVLDKLALEKIQKSEPTKFWDKDIVEYAFSESSVRSRLERLMGSGVVRVTDRAYMQRLQRRIEEDHVARQQQRIAQREAEEVEREMGLVLKGEIPVEDAPKELADHPVLVNAQIIKNISEQKMPKRKKKPAAAASPCLYPPRAAEAEAESPGADEGGEGPPPAEQQPGDPAGPMLSPEQYEKLKYESPLIKQLREVESVEELYRLAEAIVGSCNDSNTDA